MGSSPARIMHVMTALSSQEKARARAKGFSDHTDDDDMFAMVLEVDQHALRRSWWVSDLQG